MTLEIPIWARRGTAGQSVRTTGQGAWVRHAARAALRVYPLLGYCSLFSHAMRRVNCSRWGVKVEGESPICTAYA
jgi:hypothetical protein